MLWQHIDRCLRLARRVALVKEWSLALEFDQLILSIRLVAVEADEDDHQQKINRTPNHDHVRQLEAFRLDIIVGQVVSMKQRLRTIQPYLFAILIF